jgi:hypothetical protein
LEISWLQEVQLGLGRGSLGLIVVLLLLFDVFTTLAALSRLLLCSGSQCSLSTLLLILNYLLSCLVYECSLLVKLTL